MITVDFSQPRIMNHLSYSAVSSYSECGLKFMLSRFGRLDKSNWFVTVMGTIVHHITEQIDLRDAGFPFREGEDSAEAFDELYSRAIAEQADKGIEFRASGRKNMKSNGKTGGPNGKDFDWCLEWGPLLIQQWQAWREEHEFTVAVMPDGSPGVEVKVEAPVGDVCFVGYIDRVFVDPNGDVYIVDLKTGNEPTSSTQLKMYAYQLRKQYGVPVAGAAYWMAMQGDVGQSGWVEVPENIDPRLERMVGQAAAGIEQGVFLPGVSSFCGSCAVKDYCWATGGERAGEVPLSPPLVRVRRASDFVAG